MKVALFASGRGSNVENIIQFFNGNKRIKISLICSNNKSSGARVYINGKPQGYLNTKVKYIGV